MGDKSFLLTPVPELINPDYRVYQYRHDCWKVVRYNSTAPRIVIRRRDGDGYKHEDKLPQAISRAKKVCLELALCNDWKWFATFTIAQDNHDRKNLSAFYEKFTDFLKYRRKKFGVEIPYLLVPEQHGDGSWHLHGFFNSDVDQFLVSFRQLDQEGYRSESGKRLPRKLLQHDYYDWPEYRERFGFCSFGQIKSQIAAAFYVTKYISKSFLGDARKVGLKLYYCSQGLNRSVLLDGVYGPCPPLDSCLSNHYKHCSTGFMFIPCEVGDEPMMDILESYVSRMAPLPVLSDQEVEDVEQYYEIAHQYCLW